MTNLQYHVKFAVHEMAIFHIGKFETQFRFSSDDEHIPRIFTQRRCTEGE